MGPIPESTVRVLVRNGQLQRVEPQKSLRTVGQRCLGSKFASKRQNEIPVFPSNVLTVEDTGNFASVARFFHRRGVKHADRPRKTPPLYGRYCLKQLHKWNVRGFTRKFPATTKPRSRFPILRTARRTECARILQLVASGRTRTRARNSGTRPSFLPEYCGFLLWILRRGNSRKERESDSIFALFSQGSPPSDEPDGAPQRADMAAVPKESGEIFTRNVSVRHARFRRRPFSCTGRLL